MRRVWSGEFIAPGAARAVEPAPTSPSGPEIMAGSIFPQSIRRAARWADGISGFTFGPTREDVEDKFDMARKAWQQQGRATSPRLVTGFWFALGSGAKEQLNQYLHRYLAFMGADAGDQLAPHVISTSPDGLREALSRARDAGADEVLLTPTTIDPDEVSRVADLVA